MAQADLTLKDKTEKMPQTAMEISNTNRQLNRSMKGGARIHVKFQIR